MNNDFLEGNTQLENDKIMPNQPVLYPGIPLIAILWWVARIFFDETRWSGYGYISHSI